jgi:hypothetical protein
VLGRLDASRLAISRRPASCSATSMPPSWLAPMLPCALLGRLGVFPAPATACRPSVSASGLPCHGARLPATSPPCPPGPPPSGGPASLLGSARRRLRPPSLPASLAPCSAARLLGCSLLLLSPASVLGCSVPACCAGRYCSAAAVRQSVRLLGRCAVVLGASHPALRASGVSLLDRLNCSPGSSALCDCAGYCVCLLSLICLG